MIVALPTLLLPRRILHVFMRSYALTSLWLLRVVCGTKVEWRGVEKMPKTRLHRRLQAPIGLGDICALRRDRRSDLYPQARIDVAAAVRLVHAERRSDPDRSLRRHGGAGAHDGARARRRSPPAARSSFFPKARGACPAPSRATSPASSISTARPTCPACRWRSIPDCTGRGDRCCACPARLSSKSSIRSRPVSTRRRFRTGSKTRSKTRPRGLSRKPVEAIKRPARSLDACALPIAHDRRAARRADASRSSR